MESTDEKSSTKSAEQTHIAKNVTMAMFEQFLKTSGFNATEITCQACGHHTFVLPVGGAVGEVQYPMIVTMPMPQLAGKGIWNFIAVCENCSNTLFFNAGYMVKRMQEAGKL